MSDRTEELEAQVYALEDQVAGLQQIIGESSSYEKWYAEAIEASNELGFAGMSAADVIKHLAAENKAGPATAREYQQVLAKLAVIWDKRDNGTGAPNHAHNVAGKWDKDGSVCEECAVHEEARALLRRSVAVAPLPPAGTRW